MKRFLLDKIGAALLVLLQRQALNTGGMLITTTKPGALGVFYVISVMVHSDKQKIVCRVCRRSFTTS